MMKKILYIVLMLVASMEVYAQESLTFKEAVQIGLKNNVVLNQRKNQQLTVTAQRTSSMLGIGPSVSAFAQAWRTIGNQFIEQEGRVINDARTGNISGGIDASMVLFNGFNGINSYIQSDLRVDAQNHFIKRTQQDVIRDVAAQYLQCLLDTELLKIEERNLETQTNSLFQITEQVNAGSRAEVDKFTQEAQVKNAEVRVLRARFTLRNDLTTLSQTLQLDPTVAIVVEEPSWNLEFLNFEDYSLEDMYQTAITNRGDLKQSQLNKKAAQKGFAASKGSMTPSVSAFFRLNSFYSDASIPTFDDQISSNKRTQYGVQVNIPILNRWQNQTTMVQSKVSYENASIDLSNTENLVKSDVLRAYQNMKDALLAYEAAQAQFEAAELSFKLEKDRYDLGITDLVQFTTSTQTFVQAQSDLARARYQLLFQKIMIDYALGTLREEDIP